MNGRIKEFFPKSLILVIMMKRRKHYIISVNTAPILKNGVFSMTFTASQAYAVAEKGWETMPTVHVYNNNTGAIETYYKGLNEPMPYNAGGTLSVKEFRGSSCSDILWTERRAMEAWNKTRAAFGSPIPMGYAFKRIWEGGHSAMSQHYAGVSFDAGQILSLAERQRLHATALNTGAWGYVEPLYLTPTWVHFDARNPYPACPSGGYPLVSRGSRGVYVFILQDALNALGYTGGGLDGIFGGGVENAVKRYQASRGLYSDGIVGCHTWTALTRQVVGMGSTPTVVGRCY